jgi:hypothetical protein
MRLQRAPVAGARGFIDAAILTAPAAFRMDA